ncbi:MAG: hypothetical protein ABSE46_24820 [Terracidiphilus sp.]|jgi:hypothetical protein
MRNGTSNLIENIVIILAGGILLLGQLIAVSIVFIYAFAVAMLRRLSRWVAGRSGRIEIADSVQYHESSPG